MSGSLACDTREVPRLLEAGADPLAMTVDGELPVQAATDQARPRGTSIAAARKAEARSCAPRPQGRA